LHFFELDGDGFAPLRTAAVASGARSVLVAGGGSELVLAGSVDGAVSAHSLSAPPGEGPRWVAALPGHEGGGVSLARGGGADFFAVSSLRASRVDLARVAATWEAPLDESCSADAAVTASLHGAVGPRLASYSPGWGLLALAEPCGGVALWDPRRRGGAGGEAVARLRLGEGDLASSVHIDNGEGCGWPGALLACARRGGAVRLFDIRRLSAANARCAPPEERARASLVLELAGRPAAPVRTDGAAAGGNGVCFAADAARVICGAGARSGSVSMWPVASGRQAGEEEAGLAVATRPEPTPRCRQRKPRGTRKEWSH